VSGDRHRVCVCVCVCVCVSQGHHREKAAISFLFRGEGPKVLLHLGGLAKFLSVWENYFHFLPWKAIYYSGEEQTI
jgi:F0F1-type ATP synthase assembly protein I